MKLRDMFILWAVLTLIFVLSGVGCSRNEVVNPSVKASEETEEAKEIKELEQMLAHVPGMIDGLYEQDCKSLKEIIQRIKKLPDLATRLILFRKYHESLCSVHFEKMGDIHARDWKEQRDVRNLLGSHYVWLELLTEDVFEALAEGRAAPKDMFEPLFRYCETMRREAQRLGKDPGGYREGIDHIERWYGILMEAKGYQQRDFEWVKSEFQKIAGRPIRKLDEAFAARKAEEAKNDLGKVHSRGKNVQR